MAHVEGPRKGKDGRKLTRPWLAVYPNPANKSGRGGKSFERKIDAEQWLAETVVEQGRGSWIDPAAGRILFKAYAEQWLATHLVRTNTRKVYENYLAHMVELHDWELGQIRPTLIRKWQAALWGRLAPSTAGTIRGVCSTIFDDAVTDRLIASSPIKGVKRGPKPERVLVRPLERSHVFDLMDLITPRLRAAIVVGAGSGLRRGEAMGLTVDRVDFLRKVIRVDRQLLDMHEGLPVFGPPKTPASVADVPVDDRVITELSAHLARWPVVQGRGWHDPGSGRLQPMQHDGLIFTAAWRGPLLRPKMGSAWSDAEVRIWARDAGHRLCDDGWRIPSDVRAKWAVAHPDGAGTRFHDLRHYYASVLIAAGLSIKTVQARLRHQNASETLDTYSHLFKDDEDRTRAAIAAMWAGYGEDGTLGALSV